MARARERQVSAAKVRFAATGGDQNDIEASRTSFLRNFCFFNAPHAASILLPPCAGHRAAADCGMDARSLMLSFAAHGLASGAHRALRHPDELVKRTFGVNNDLRVLFAIAIGYQDQDHPANAASTDRAPIDTAVSFHP